MKCLLAVHQISEEAARNDLYRWGAPRDLELVHHSTGAHIAFNSRPGRIEYLFSYEAPATWDLSEEPIFLDLPVVPVEI
jgi:hypothetical protein